MNPSAWMNLRTYSSGDATLPHGPDGAAPASR